MGLSALRSHLSNDLLPSDESLVGMVDQVSDGRFELLVNLFQIFVWVVSEMRRLLFELLRQSLLRSIVVLRNILQAH